MRYEPRPKEELIIADEDLTGFCIEDHKPGMWNMVNTLREVIRETYPRGTRMHEVMEYFLSRVDWDLSHGPKKSCKLKFYKRQGGWYSQRDQRVESLEEAEAAFRELSHMMGFTMIKDVRWGKPYRSWNLPHGSKLRFVKDSKIVYKLFFCASQKNDVE